jgi:uncharacterized membrane protein
MPLSQKTPEPVPPAGVAIPTGSTLAAIMVIYGLIAVVLLSINLPPFQNPDELTHFFRAEHISRGNLIGERFETYKSGGLVEKNIFPAHAPFAEIPTSPDNKLDHDKYARAGEVRWSGGSQMVSFPNTANYPPFLYMPSVVGIWIGKLADLSIVETLYLSRLLSGMTSVAVGAAAIALAGTFAPWLFAMLLLPMSLSQMTAVSQDGLMFSLAALSAAIIARAMTGGSISIRFFRLLVLCLALIGMARPPYAALALLVPAVPGFRRATRLAGAGMVAAPAILWTLLAAAVSQVPLVHFDIMPDPGAQMGFLLESPSRILTVAAQTLDANWVFYRKQFIGQLGWLEVALPNSYHAAAWVALLVAFVASLPVAGEAPRPAGPDWRSIMLAGSAVTCTILGLFAIQYLTWTAPGSGLVEGIQGRYFIVVALLAAPFLRFVIPAGRAVSLNHAWAVAATILFPAISLTVMIRQIVVRYYLSAG